MKQILTLALFFCLPMLALAQQDSALRKTFTGTAKKAADTLAKRDGEKVAVVLTEVNPENVRYKRFDYQDGPTFTISKADISYIVYANGMRDSFETYVKAVNKPDSEYFILQPSGWGYNYKGNYITEPDMLVLASQLHDKNLDILINEVEKRRTWHTVTLLGGIFLLGDGLYLIATNRSVRYHIGGVVAGNTPASQSENRTIGRCIFLGGLAAEGVTLYLRFNRRKYSHLVMDAYNKDVTK